MAAHAAQLGAHAHRTLQQLIEARGAGLQVPEAAASAVDVLAALSIAWAHNAHGQPAPTEALRTLGLITTGDTTP